MIYYKVVRIFLSIIAFITMILTPITTLLLGIVGSIPIIGAIFILIISLIWMVILFPLLALSWLSMKIKILTPMFLLLGLPLSVIAFLYANLMPSFGEMDSRFSKILFASVFPYNFQVFQLATKQLPPNSYDEFEDIQTILQIESNNKFLKAYIDIYIRPHLY